MLIDHDLCLQESMEREYSVAMETMKEKMLEMQQQGYDKEATKRKKPACTQVGYLSFAAKFS